VDPSVKDEFAPNIRDKVQNLKERLNGVVQKPPLNNEVQISVLEV
jgi:hypothetical protein